MKKILFLAVLAFSLAGCKDDYQSVFDTPASERTRQLIDSYYKTLTAAPNGWILTVDSQTRGGFNTWVSFTNQNRCTMLSDGQVVSQITEPTASVPASSSYRISPMQIPTLIFDTYNYLHLLGDPNQEVNGGEKGKGLYVDYEYEILQYDNGGFDLRGTTHSTTGTLRPATADEAAQIAAGRLTSVYSQVNSYLSAMLHPSFRIGGRTYEFSTNNGQIINLFSLEGDDFDTHKFNSWVGLQSLVSAVPMSDVTVFEPAEVGGHYFTGLVYENNKLQAVADGQLYEVYDEPSSVMPVYFGPGMPIHTLYFRPSVILPSLTDPYLTVFRNAEATMNAYSPSTGGRTIKGMTLEFIDHPNYRVPVMKLSMTIHNLTTGANYTAPVWYYYYEYEDGVITFTDRDQGGGSGEAIYEPRMQAVIDYFCKVTYTTYSTSSWSLSEKNTVTPRSFTLQWKTSATPGVLGDMVAFVPADAPTDNFLGTITDIEL